MVYLNMYKSPCLKHCSDDESAGDEDEWARHVVTAEMQINVCASAGD